MSTTDEARFNSALKLLESTEDGDRVLAIKELVKCSTTRAVPYLEKATNDENVAVRYYAKKGLKILTRAIAKVRARESGVFNIKSSVINPALCLIREQIHQRIESSVSEEYERSATEEDVTPQDSSPLMESSVESSVEYDYVELRNTALLVLDSLIETLRAVVAHGKHQQSIAAAAQALGFLGDESSVAPLLTLLEQGAGSEEVVEALSLLGDVSVIPVFEKLLYSDEHNSLHHSIVKALLSFNTEKSCSLIKKVLSGKDTALQCAAIRGLSETEDSRFIPTLLEMTGRVENFVDYEIMRVFYVNAAENPDIGRNLLARLDECNSAKIIASIISVLGHSKNESYKDWIAPFLSDNDRRVRANAVEALGKLNLSSSVVKELLLPLVRDKDNRIAANSSMILAVKGLPEGWDGLLRMVNRSAKWHRASACYALGQVKHSDAIPILSYALVDKDSDVRLNAAKALRHCVDERAEENLCEVLSDKNQWIRRYAVEALSLIDTESARTRLKTYLGEETNNHNITMALICCGKTAAFCDDELLSIFLKFMTHECDKVRIGAIEALEYMVKRTDLNLLAPGLGDKDSAVRARTVIAIWKHGEFSICDSLKTMLDKNDSFTQSSAAEVLCQIGLMLRNLEFEPNTENLLEALRAHPDYGRN